MRLPKSRWLILVLLSTIFVAIVEAALRDDSVDYPSEINYNNSAERFYPPDIPVAGSQPRTGYAQLMHPLFLTANLRNPNCNGQAPSKPDMDCAIVLHTRARSYVLEISGTEFAPVLKIMYTSVLEYAMAGYNHAVVREDHNGNVTFVDDIEAARQFLKTKFPSGRTSLAVDLDFDSSCHNEPARAFEKFFYKRSFYSISIDDFGFCISKYKQGFSKIPKGASTMEDTKTMIERSILLPIQLVSQGPNDKAGHYKYTAVTVLKVHDIEPMKVVLFDEAGRISFLYLHILRESPLDVRLSTDMILNNPRKPWSYWAGQVQLTDNRLEAPGYVGTRTEEQALEDFNKLSNGVDRLRDHFDFSFIEAITKVDGALCWSTGLYLHDRPSVRCLGGRSGAFLPSKLLNQNRYTVYAMEVVEFGNHTYYHFVTNTLTSDPHKLELKNTYWFCALAGTVSAKHVLEVPSSPLSARSCTKTDIDRTPVDIFHLKTDQCNKLVSMYSQFYQYNEPDETITSAGDIVVANLTHSVNAALFQDNRIYMFLASSMMALVDVDVVDCRIVYKDLTYYSASEILRQFGRTYGHEFTGEGATRSSVQRARTFDSIAPIFLDFRDYSDGRWDPPTTTEADYLPEEAHIKGSRVEGPDNSLVVMFSTLLGIVVVLLSVIVYFIWCGKVPEQSQADALVQLPREPATPNSDTSTVRSAMSTTSSQQQAQTTSTKAKILSALKVKTATGSADAGASNVKESSISRTLSQTKTTDKQSPNTAKSGPKIAAEKVDQAATLSRIAGIT